MTRPGGIDSATSSTRLANSVGPATGRPGSVRLTMAVWLGRRVPAGIAARGRKSRHRMTRRRVTTGRVTLGRVTLGWVILHRVILHRIGSIRLAGRVLLIRLARLMAGPGRGWLSFADRSRKLRHGGIGRGGAGRAGGGGRDT